MKISVITPTYNNERTIACTAESILAQTHADIEHIIIDNCSTDGTLDAIRRIPYAGSRQRIIVSEPDRGIYHAINKGIGMASGDVIGILHTGDIYSSPDVLEQVADRFADPECGMLYGDMSWHRPNASRKRVRYFCAKEYTPEMLRLGIAPPHPTMYISRRIVDRIGLYKEGYRIAADFDIFVRLMLVNGISGTYLPVEMVSMATGGRSGTIYNRLVTNTLEKRHALRQNGIDVPLIQLLRRYFINLRQYRPLIPRNKRTTTALSVNPQ